MNKQNTIIIIILLLLGVLGIYLLISNAPDTDFANKDSTKESTQSENTSKIDETEDITKDDSIMDVLNKAPKNAVKYKISEGTVSYVAQKRFLSSTDTEVIGSTDELRGSGWFDFNTNSFAAVIQLDFSTLSTDNQVRDAEVLKMFKDTNISVQLSVEDEDSFLLDEEVELDVPVILTVNGVSRSEIFTVTVTVSENEFVASGTTSILMSEYGIEPPNSSGVYTVDDALELTFDIVGESSSDMDINGTDSENKDSENANSENQDNVNTDNEYVDSESNDNEDENTLNEDLESEETGNEEVTDEVTDDEIVDEEVEADTTN